MAGLAVFVACGGGSNTSATSGQAPVLVSEQADKENPDEGGSTTLLIVPQTVKQTSAKVVQSEQAAKTVARAVEQVNETATQAAAPLAKTAT